MTIITVKITCYLTNQKNSFKDKKFDANNNETIN